MKKNVSCVNDKEYKRILEPTYNITCQVQFHHLETKVCRHICIDDLQYHLSGTNATFGDANNSLSTLKLVDMCQFSVCVCVIKL
jgi:hypothetical protein